VVAFRGTDFDVKRDVFTDLTIVPAIFDEFNRDAPVSLLDRVASTFGIGGKAAVHLGFLTAWRSVEQAVHTVIQDCTQGEEGWKVSFVGHSLGGALATLAAADYAAER
jgi:predicted lipase